MYDNINKQFCSLSEFLTAVHAGETQKDFSDYYPSGTPSLRESEQMKEFCGTSSMDEADRLIKEGDKASMELLKKYGFEPDTKKYNFAQRRKIMPAVVGFAPIVPNAIAGVPVAMQAVTSTQAKTKVVNVVLSVTVGHNVKKELYAQYAAKVLNGCLTLEKRGVRVNLYAFIGAYKAVGNRRKDKEQYITCFVKIKDSKTAIDPLAVSYPVINASFLRRHFCRLMDTTPGLHRNFVSGYGTPIIHIDDIVKMLPKQIKDTETIITSYYARNSLKSAFENVK